jgi:hypothetical protein
MVERIFLERMTSVSHEASTQTAQQYQDDFFLYVFFPLMSQFFLLFSMKLWVLCQTIEGLQTKINNLACVNVSTLYP